MPGLRKIFFIFLAFAIKQKKRSDKILRFYHSFYIYYGALTIYVLIKQLEDLKKKKAVTYSPTLGQYHRR
ncbi:hypothetical protein AsAng_0040230 [Aureispira anguillae]|uniref:Uncharacterized protein n=1 Tax=Aureispira anguillae TaxID=2864201 RepID=A0A915YI25_9BACT|nr:hypothetical protein AsAng_0040230 [Aureispira anguillae]